jgi:uncharacterized membrane protein
MLLLLTRIVALVSVGLYAGIIFGDRLGASYSRQALNAGSFVVFQQIQHVHFKPVLLPLTLSAVLASVLWVALSRWRWHSPAFWVITAAALCMLVAFLVTRIVNFPINGALMTWNAASPPSDVRSLWAPWERAHTVRAIASVFAFVLQSIGLSLQTGR